MSFEPFPKIPRLNREIIITEKIDGTNAQVFITTDNDDPVVTQGRCTCTIHDGVQYYIAAGSRKRWIVPGDDNFGFAVWVVANSSELVKLGPGRHFGEWWGKGIQRGYGLEEKRFSLFNTSRWAGNPERPACCDVVPVLYTGAFDTEEVDAALFWLKSTGSTAAPGFMDPEGIIVFHTAANQVFKATLENDHLPKGVAA